MGVSIVMTATSKVRPSCQVQIIIQKRDLQQQILFHLTKWFQRSFLKNLIN